MERPLFRDSIRNRRCVVPASHFYEWDQSKNKVTFCREDSPVLYMAGFYQLFEDKEHFIIAVSYTHLDVYKRQVPDLPSRG